MSVVYSLNGSTLDSRLRGPGFKSQWGVVYFNQCVVAAHSKHWLKYAFSMFLMTITGTDREPSIYTRNKRTHSKSGTDIRTGRMPEMD